jgi:hypothetical protein
VVSRAHGPPWPRSWWRLLGVTSRSDAGSLPPPPAGPVAGGHGETADALLHDIYDDRSRPSSQLRRVAASAEIRLGERPGQRQQHERRQKSRPAGTGRQAVPVPPNLGAVPRSCPSAGSRPSATGARAATCPGCVPVRHTGTAALSSEKKGGDRCPRCPPAFRQLGSRLSPGPRGGILAKCKPAGKRLQRWRFRLGLHTIPSRVCTRCHAQRRSETPLVRASSSGCAAHL